MNDGEKREFYHLLIEKVELYKEPLENGQMVKEISTSELEAACRKCIHLVVSNVKALSKVLDEIGLEYTILSDKEADIFGEIGITKLVSKLSAENCEVLSMQERDENLENYYINLVGGVNNA